MIATDDGGRNDIPERCMIVSRPLGPGAPVVITVVRSNGCHLCDDTQAALIDLSREYSLRVSYLDAGDPVGSELVTQHRPALFPLVLVDGRFFSQGRLPRGRLRQLLAARHPVGAQ